MNWEEYTFWTKQVPCERLTLSTVGRFVYYYFCCIYGLHESAREKLAMHMLQQYKLLDVPEGFRFDQEPIFTYKSRNII